MAPPPRPSHIMQHPTTHWVFLRPSCILRPPTSRFDSLGGLFLLSWHLHPLSSSLHPPTSSQPHPTTLSQPRYTTPNKSNDSLGVFYYPPAFYDPQRVDLTHWVIFFPSPCPSTLPPCLSHAPPPRPSHVMQHPTSPTTRWVFLRPSCILQPPMSRFDSLGGLFLLSWYLHPLSSSLHPPTSSQPCFATPNKSLDSLGGFFLPLLPSTTPNESI